MPLFSLLSAGNCEFGTNYKEREKQKKEKIKQCIFKDANIPYRDPETLTNFLKIIDENFDYNEDSEQLGDAYEFLLNSLGSAGDLGMFRTPRHIIDFIVSLVEPTKEDRILDPACGTAGFLISTVFLQSLLPL